MSSILNGMSEPAGAPPAGVESVMPTRRALGDFAVDAAPLDFGNDTPVDVPGVSPTPNAPVDFGSASPAQDFGSEPLPQVDVLSPDDIQPLAMDTPPVITNPVFSSIDVNKLVQAGGAVYRYVRQLDAAGNAKYTPQQVQVRQVGGNKVPGWLIAAGIGVALLALRG